MTPWSTEAALHEDHDLIRVSMMLSIDPGPMREFRPFLDIDLDEADATELLGKLSLALAALRDRREDARLPKRRARVIGDPAAVLDEIEPGIASVSEGSLRMRFGLSDSPGDRGLLQSIMLEQGWISHTADFGAGDVSITWWRRGTEALS